MNNLLERMGIHMPQYYQQKTAGYHIGVAPKNKWRSFLKWLHLEPPYFVGDRISLTFTFTKINAKAKSLDNIATLVSYYPQNERSDPPYRFTAVPSIGLEPVKMDYKSRAEITKDGTVEIYIADKNYVKRSGNLQSSPMALFSAGIVHRDFVNRDNFLVLVGMLGGGVLGCIASIISPLILAHYFGVGK
jgi:hypothetical protein